MQNNHDKFLTKQYVYARKVVEVIRQVRYTLDFITIFNKRLVVVVVFLIKIIS